MSEAMERDPDDVAAYDEGLAQIVVGELEPLTAPIEIVDYDPGWPALYEREEVRIRAALGEKVVRLEHTGSTSVPTLPAKPIMALLEVQDSAESRLTCPTSKPPATFFASGSPSGSSTEVSKGRTRL